ncbi:MAG: hypothetical protein OXI82_01970 [Nitrospinae bacterium]|nr:hypothetical protein [Nitrospinota bacterium]
MVQNKNARQRRKARKNPMSIVREVEKIRAGAAGATKFAQPYMTGFLLF